ncbi:MAG: PAS domain S-box protein [Deltaproteobacteria bacterium]|nr:PAS domain S-box protein [Deltaproteobacteria bacterium]
MKYKISELIDVEKSQRLLDCFCDAMGIAAAIIDLQGDVVIRSRWQKICTDFHRVNQETFKKCVESDTRLANELQQGKNFSIYQCRNGLTDAASPIIIEGEHVANAFAGQFFLNPPDREFFLRQAAQYGFDENEYLEAVFQVPVVNERYLPAVLNFLATFAEMVASVGMERFRHMEATEALRESETRLRTIIEHSNELFYIHDTEYTLTYVSRTAMDILGYDAEELKQKWIQLIKDNPLNKQMSAFVRKAITTGERQPPYLLRMKKKDGTPILLEIDESPVKDAAGRVVAISGAARDVTGQKEIEQRLLKSEKGFRDLFDSISDLIYTQDLNGRFISVNKALSTLFGYERNEVVGRLTTDFMKPEMMPFFESQYLEEIKTKGYQEGITSYFTKHGEELYVEYRSSLVKPEDGEPYISGSGRDVTERISARREIKRLQNQILHSQKMEALGLMAGGVAHDLNNILSGIVSYPELLLMDLPQESPFRKPIETIKESGMRAADVVADLLTIARGVATGKEVLNLNAVIKTYLNSLEFERLEKTHTFIDFKVDLALALLNIRGSSVHIEKSLMNLVINACEAIRGRGTVAISTANRYLDEPFKGYEDVRRGEYVVLTVSDNGSGISSEDLHRIFEPFYTKKVMGRSGTGLGLAVVWNTLQDHNGYINITSNDRGSTFELYFPVAREDLGPQAKQTVLDDYLGHGEKVLVIDDEERQREIACGMLNKLGYVADAVPGGDDAIEYLKQYPVDMILLDMVMPRGMGGRETYEKIITIRPGQKAIIASGYARTEEVEAAQKLGAGRYIKKPYTLEKIGIAIKEELRKQTG